MADALAVAAPSATAGTTHLGIVAGLAMGPAVGLGLGRFAYALLLPAMRADLGWSYAAAGAMNTANAAGYLVGALAAAPIAARVGDKRGFLARRAADRGVAAGDRAGHRHRGAGAAARGGRRGGRPVAGHRRGAGRVRRRRRWERPADPGAGRLFRRRGLWHGGLGVRRAGAGGRDRLAERLVRAGRARAAGRRGGAAGAGPGALGGGAGHLAPARVHGACDARAARGAGELCAVRRGLHRVHHVHRGVSALAAGLRRGRGHAVPGAARGWRRRSPGWPGCRCWRGCRAGAAWRRPMPW